MVEHLHHVKFSKFEISCLPNLRDHMQASRSTPDRAPLNCIQYALHLLWVGQGLCQQHSNASTHLCQEVRKITRGQAQLVLHSNLLLKLLSPSINTIA